MTLSNGPGPTGIISGICISSFTSFSSFLRLFQSFRYSLDPERQTLRYVILGLAFFLFVGRHDKRRYALVQLF